MHAATGLALEGDAHLAQSIADILTTPIGSRVMRRDYGSLLSELIDAPFNGATRLRLYGAAVGALMRWEPRIRINRIELSQAAEAGAFVLDIQGQRTDTPAASAYTHLTIPLRVRSH